jgi:hypothetical protein
MSKVDSQIDDAKKLALRCKTLELQLRQSVSKKDHHEVTSKLERQIDALERDLDRARAENQKTIALNKQIAGVEGLISSVIKTANAQGKTLDFIEEEASTRGKALGAQGKVLDALAAKLSQGTVPSNVHLQALSKIRDLEEDKRGMVRRFEYNSLEARCGELSRQLSTMVPSSDYSSLKERFDDVTTQMGNMVPASDYSTLKQRVEELEGTISSMVPREQLASSEARVRELETRLAEHVPQSVYDELVSKVVSLAEAVTGGAIQPEEARAEPQPEAAEPEPAAQPASSAEPTGEPNIEPSVEVSIPEAPEPQSQSQPQVEASAPAQVEASAPAEPSVEVSIAEAPEPQPQPQVEASAPAEPSVEVSIAEVSIAEAPEPQPQVETSAPAEPAAAPAATESPDSVPEVREIQSQLAELSTQALEARGDASASGPETVLSAFTFSGTDIVVRTGPEFAQAIGKMPTSILETDVKSGGLEKWFASSLADESTAESLRKVREGGAIGEELHSQVASSVAKYAIDPTAQQAAPAIAVTLSNDTETTA